MWSGAKSGGGKDLGAEVEKVELRQSHRTFGHPRTVVRSLRDEATRYTQVPAKDDRTFGMPNWTDVARSGHPVTRTGRPVNTLTEHQVLELIGRTSDLLDRTYGGDKRMSGGPSQTSEEEEADAEVLVQHQPDVQLCSDQTSGQRWRIQETLDQGAESRGPDVRF